jgi:lipopolysaccharide/colanic/teichoic acid biosynthesis glycosyltransferase
MSALRNALNGAVPTRKQRQSSFAQSDAGTNLSRYGMVHAVPADEVDAAARWSVEAVIYRGFEMAVALIGLVVCLPIVLIAAILIRYDSPGPALFFHRRVARSIKLRGRDLVDRTDLHPPPGGYDPDTWYYVPDYFTLVKLRTMHCDARTRFPEFYAYKFAPEEFHDQYPTHRHDPRVTRMGRFLRKLSVDEIPNLWSVLVGDIRLVGPRPEAPEVLQYYSPEEMYKFVCQPGITGLAQINGRGFLNWGETLAWDLQYVRTRGVALDLKIIFITLSQVITRRGAF